MPPEVSVQVSVSPGTPLGVRMAAVPAAVPLMPNVALDAETSDVGSSSKPGRTCRASFLVAPLEYSPTVVSARVTVLIATDTPPAPGPAPRLVSTLREMFGELTESACARGADMEHSASAMRRRTRTIGPAAD